VIVSFIVSVIAGLSGQPVGAPAPLVAELCNDTPVRVAFTVSYPAGARSERRRGWLVVEPGACSGGSIGQTTGGTAHVHAMSGGYGWPSDTGGEQRCAPPSSHDDIAAQPPCRSGERAFPVAPAPLENRGTHHRLEVRVACADLAGADRALCETGRRDGQGFAERVRTLEICNRDRSAVAMAVAGEALDGSVEVEGWIGIEPGQCRTAWRGLSAQGVVYAHTRGSGQAVGAEGYPRFCVSPDEGFSRVAASPQGEAACPQGLQSRAFRPVRFGANVSLMSLDIEGL